jgi:hypothetical protein
MKNYILCFQRIHRLAGYSKGRFHYSRFARAGGANDFKHVRSARAGKETAIENGLKRVSNN